jgi:hypothetical protein
MAGKFTVRGGPCVSSRQTGLHPSHPPSHVVTKPGEAIGVLSALLKKPGYPLKAGQLEDSHRDLKCRKVRLRWLRIQKPEAFMLQSVPPYVDALFS